MQDGAVAHAAELDAGVLRAWASGAADVLAEQRGVLDAMNLFPVPDSDTGTNLYLTLAEAAAAVAVLPAGADLHQVARAFVRGAVVGARGNSGVIVSQYLAGLVETLVAPCDDWSLALDAAARSAYRAVADPVEGTVLTVAREVHAGAVGSPGDGPTALQHGLARGHAGLGRTSALLPVLREAGVCDAGGYGLLLVLGALLRSLGGTPPDAACPAVGGAEGRPCDGMHRLASQVAGGEPAVEGHREHAHDHGGGEFEVMFVVTEDTPSPPSAAATPPVAGDVGDELRAALSAVGGSVAVVGASGLWQAHVHTDRPLEALAVQDSLQVTTRPASVRHLPSQTGVHGSQRPVLGLVAATSAPGLVPDLARAGAVVVLVRPGQDLRDVLHRAVDDTGAGGVLVLSSAPVAPGVRPPAAQVVDGLSEIQLVAGAAALALAEPGASAEQVRSAVTSAVDGVLTAAVPDVGGLGDAGRVHAAALDLLASAEGAEVLTVITAEGTEARVTAVLREELGVSHPQLEVVVLPGGASHADVLLGVE